LAEYVLLKSRIQKKNGTIWKKEKYEKKENKKENITNPNVK
jgi:hypothetical protein